jgi:hypothetical protein
MKLIRFLRDMTRPADGVLLHAPGAHPNVIICNRRQIFRKGQMARLPQQYIAGLTEGEDFEFTDSH